MNFSNLKYKFYKNYHIDEEWQKLLGENYKVSNLNRLEKTIVEIITERNNVKENQAFIDDDDSKIGW